MNDIRVDMDVVRRNVDALNELFDELDAGVMRINGVRTMQDTTIWTDIPACASFAQRYREALGTLEDGLRATWTKIHDQAEALRTGAAAFVASDEDSVRDLTDLHASLDALVARAEAGPASIVDAVAPVLGASVTGAVTALARGSLTDAIGSIAAGAGAIADVVTDTGAGKA